MTHIQNASACFASNGEGLFKDLVQDFVGYAKTFLLDFFLALEIGIGLIGNLSDAFLYCLAEFVGFGAQRLVRELLHLRLKRIDGRDSRQQALDLAFILGAKNLA